MGMVHQAVLGRRDMKSLAPILGYAKRHRRRVGIAIAGMIAFTLLGLVPPLFMRYLLDTVVAGGAWDQLAGVVAAYALSPVVAHLVRLGSVRWLVLSGARMIADLRLAMYRRVLNLGMRYHSESSAGAIVCRIMDDANMLQRLLTTDTVRLIVDSVVLIFALVVMFAISVQLSVLSCGLVFLYVIAYRFYAFRIRSATQAYRSLLDQVAGRLQETLAGVRQVRIYNRENWENNEFLDRTAESLDRAFEGSMASVNLTTACGVVSGIGSTIIVGLGTFMVVRGEMTYGDLTAFNIYLWMLITPVVRLTELAGSFAETMVSVRRISELVSEEPDILSRPGAVRVDSARGEIEFDKVDFSYEPGTPLYKGLSLRVPAGSVVALVGKTGCGKSTFASLLTRAWNVRGGSIRIDGRDIRDIELVSLRRLFGIVLQSPVTFDGTIRENIAYGCPDASDEEILRAAEAAEFSSVISALPEGLDTLIGTSGVKLSTGERQRLSIARAVLRDPSILIMDEATASLDSHSEALIQKALGRVLRGRTSIVIAHRLSTITSADNIVVMHRGAIVEQGRHEELLARGGRYARLYAELRGGGEGRP